MEANNPQREALKICTNNDVCVHKKRTMGDYVICSAVSFQCFKGLLFSPGIFRRVFLLFDFVMFILLLHYCAIISRYTYLVYLFWSHTCSPCIQMYTDSSTMTRWGHMYRNSYKDSEYIGLLEEKKRVLLKKFSFGTYLNELPVICLLTHDYKEDCCYGSKNWQEAILCETSQWQHAVADPEEAKWSIGLLQPYKN